MVDPKTMKGAGGLGAGSLAVLVLGLLLRTGSTAPEFGKVLISFGAIGLVLALLTAAYELLRSD